VANDEGTDVRPSWGSGEAPSVQHPSSREAPKFGGKPFEDENDPPRLRETMTPPDARRTENIIELS
jgi:hypothetical protein